MKPHRIAATFVLLASMVPVAAKAPAPAKLTSDEFKATFVTGKPFASSSNSGKKFLLTLNADGTALIVPSGKKQGNSGTWSYSDKGYCSKWGTGVEHCYSVEKAGTKYAVLDKGGQTVATWTPGH